MNLHGTESFLKRCAAQSAVGSAIAFCLWLVPCQSPPLRPGELNWARFAGALVAAGAAAFEMRRRRTAGQIDLHRRILRLWRVFAAGVVSFFLIYFLFVVHIPTGGGPVAVPVGIGSNCCGRLPNKDCILQKLNLSADSVRRCWGEYSVATVHLGLVSSYWWTAGAGGALIGLLLLRWGTDRAGQPRVPPHETPRVVGEAPGPTASELEYDLFLSYASKDGDFVEGLVGDLQSRDLTIWWDQHKLEVGDALDAVIKEGLQASRHFAVVLSPSSVISEWVLAEAEYARTLANERRKKGMASDLIPILHQECDVPLLLKRLKYADFTQSYDHGLAELLRKLRPPSSPR